MNRPNKPLIGASPLVEQQIAEDKRPRTLGHRYYVKIESMQVSVEDSFAGRLVRSWMFPVDVHRCECCHHELKRTYRVDHNHVAEAIELCQKLNQNDVRDVVEVMNKRRSQEIAGEAIARVGSILPNILT